MRGFTIIELMITVVILAIIATVAVPGFGNLIEANRAVSGSNLLLSSIKLARSEALRRGDTVTFSTDGGLASGWCVHNGDNAVDCDDDAQRIRRFEATAGLAYTASVADLVFDRRGFLTPQVQRTFTVRPADCTAGENRLVTITVSPVGRTSSQTGACP